MKITPILTRSQASGCCGKCKKPKKGEHIDTQLFPECKGTPEDRDVVKKHERRKKTKKASTEIDDDIIKSLENYWRPVESSFIDSIAYADLSKILEIKMKSGKKYTFFGVPLEDYEALMAAPSKGAAFSEFRKRHKEVPF